MSGLRDYVTLPPQITDFERGYLRRVNAYATRFLVLNVPIFVIIAAANHTGPLLTLAMASMLVAGPVLAERVCSSPRSVSRVFGVAGIGMAGLLVHIGQGPMQIEMHFYFFIVIGLLTVFGNPSVILLAAGTMAAHHLAIYLVFPTSVFNYRASLWVVAVHTGFIFAMAAVCCFVARSFFDKVIGLEEAVAMRTSQIEAQNRNLALILDSMGQGFLRVAPDGSMSAQRSAILEKWLGAPSPDERVWDYFGRTDPEVGSWFRLGFRALVDDLVPVEVTLDQLPTELLTHGTTFSLAYRPIFDGGKVGSILVIVSDITAEIARRDAEAEANDVVAMFERLTKDRPGFVDFLTEAQALVEAVASPDATLVDARRDLHTLKGNALVVGMVGFGRVCHELESRMELTEEPLGPADRALLVDRWRASTQRIEGLLGDGVRHVELRPEDSRALVAAVAGGVARPEIVQMIEDLRLEPTELSLERIAEDARRVAARLGKGDIHVAIDGGGLRLSSEKWSPLWSSVMHLVRNALDHGIEAPEERNARGKPRFGSLSLSTRFDGDELVFSFGDDGGGIDWSKVKHAALARGLPHGTHEELVAALFGDGVSTRTEVSEYSGRGVGMSAVAATVRELSGHILVQTEAGRGTRIELRFPRSLARSRPREMLHRARDIVSLAPAAGGWQ